MNRQPEASSDFPHAGARQIRVRRPNRRRRRVRRFLRSADLIDWQGGVPRPTGEKYLGSGDRNHLTSQRPANAVAQRDAPFRCRRSAQHRAVPHEEIGLHPARAARRNGNGLSVPPAPAPQPDHDEVALRRRRCEMDLHRRSINHSGQRGRSVGAQERDRVFRSVSNRDDHSEASPRNAADLHPVWPR